MGKHGCASSDIWLGTRLYFLNKLPALNLCVLRYTINPSKWCNRKDKMTHDAPAVPTPAFHQCIKVQRMSSLLQHHLLFWGQSGWCCTTAWMRSRVYIYLCTLTCITYTYHNLVMCIYIYIYTYVRISITHTIDGNSTQTHPRRFRRLEMGGIVELRSQQFINMEQRLRRRYHKRSELLWWIPEQ